MKNENKLDQLFKKGLEDPEIPFNELDWIKMADKLDASAPKKVRPLWLYTAVSAAAALLLVLFWFLSNNDLAVQKKINHNVKAKSKPATIDTKSPDTNEAPLAKSKEPDLKVSEAPSSAQSMDYLPISPSMKTPEAASTERPMLADVKMPELLANRRFAANSPGIGLSIPNNGHILSTSKPKEQDIKDVIKKIDNATPGKLVLSILAAPDITNTKLSIGKKVSSNFGLLLTYPISKKLSVTSGAIYARKLYDYGGTGPSAYGIAGAPWQVDADCYVIDVPINLNYQVFKKKNISISVNSGLSSYFMLKEKYNYIKVEADGTSKLTALEFNNQNKHILGVANIAVSFDHKVNRNLSIGVQPFYKVPLTGIGYYDSDLKSKGVAFSISLSPFGKKK
jgi:hypothetical protein